jgi:nicotinamidase/pyrazinamidase
MAGPSQSGIGKAGKAMKRVFIDVDTQVDFVFPAGALYVPGAEKILPAIAALNRYAVENDVPLISTMDAHSENDPEFAHWPAHCVVGTVGQTKPAQTLIGTRMVIPAKAAEIEGFNAQQIVLEKVTTNCFDNPNLSAMLEALSADCYVVYGVVTEICVKFAALGLLRTGARVEVVTDGVRHLSESKRDAMLSEFAAGGGVLTTVSELCG